MIDLAMLDKNANSHPVKAGTGWPNCHLKAGRGKGRAARARLAIVFLAFGLCAAALFSLTAGASDVSFFAFLRATILGEGMDALGRDRLIIMEIRLPRMVLGVLVGAGLADSGALMQGLFRNPLADPGLVGVSSGAGLGAVSMIVLGGTALAPVTALLGIYALPIAAFLGGLACTILLYRVATRRGRTSVATMLLAGIALGALAGAATGALIYIADDRQLRDLTFWGLGSLAGANWTKIFTAGPIILLVICAAPMLARGLNALALGEAAAGHLGIPVQRIKRIAITTVAAATGATVAVSGAIGFIGIVVPHMLRQSIGPDHRYLLPAAALLGAILLLLADAVSRMVVAPAELPIGIITALFGAPFFLWILLRQRGIIDL